MRIEDVRMGQWVQVNQTGKIIGITKGPSNDSYFVTIEYRKGQTTLFNINEIEPMDEKEEPKTT